MIDEKKLIEEMWNNFNSYYNVANRFKEEETKMADRVLGGVQCMIESQPKVGEWIPCSERLPEERDSIFKKFKGTDKWKDAMFEKISSQVQVTIEFEDGKRMTSTSRTLDGKWRHELEPYNSSKVVAWKPLDEPYKEEETE